MYNLSATNKLQDGGTHFATLLTITSSSSKWEHSVSAPRRWLRISDARKVDVRLPETGNSKSHGARPVHPIITMSMKKSLSGWAPG